MFLWIRGVLWVGGNDSSIGVFFDIIYWRLLVEGGVEW